ncbi:reverse transcriptase domain-containing protein [Tanacetum coccineum]
MIQNKVPPKLGDPRSFLIPCNFNKAFSCNALSDLGASINFMPYSLYAKLSLKTLKPTRMSVRLANRSFQYPVGIAKNMLVKVEEDFDAVLDEGSKILLSIEGTILEEELFAEFDEFIAMTTNDNSESESDEEETQFKKITVNTDYKIKTSLEEPPSDLELKPLPDTLEYVFLEEPSFLPVIISSQLSEQNKSKLISVLKRHKQAFAWKTIDIPRICPSFCKHKIHILDDKKPVIQKLRRLNPNMQEVVKKEIVKLLDIDIIYPITDSPWVGERMPFRLCNAPTTFQICMLAIFYDMIEESVKVFMDDFSVFGNSFDNCLNNLDKMLQRCKDAHLLLNWEKCHFMVKEGIVLEYKVSRVGLEVDKAKIDVISKLPPLLISKLLEKDTPFEFNDECHNAFELLKEKLICALVIQTLNPAQQNYTITEKELMAVVFAFDKFRSYMVLSKTIMHTDHSALRHLFKKQDAKPCLICWILLLQEFDIKIKDKKGIENVAGDHLSRIENDETSDNNELDKKFPGETLMEINTKYEP